MERKNALIFRSSAWEKFFRYDAILCMARRLDKLAVPLERLDAAVLALLGGVAPKFAVVIERWRTDAAALRFHLRQTVDWPTVTVVLGGTGTGKSTLVNRLVGTDVTAASFRRTFTAGPVAIVGGGADLPNNWLNVERTAVTDLPAKGEAGKLVVVQSQSLGFPLVDTPDLDGDQPAHHAQADRAFRWAGRLLFVVTPEKYQMTELLPYYRLARRYGTAALFVMNKCEENGVVEDFRRQLADREWADATVYVVPRDDAAYQSPTGADLGALREALNRPTPIAPADRESGLANRVSDVATRLADQVIAPLRQARREVDQLISTLRAMETPAAGVDVNPITLQLQRRLQQRSVLYLIGPQRVLDRVRQVPTLLARLPRATWDWVMRGHAPIDLIDPKSTGRPGEPPDFHAILADQFTVVRSRLDDAIRSQPAGGQWATDDAAGYGQSMIDPGEAGKIADGEIADLKNWLETRWNATPRDTRILHSMLKYLPGGKKLTQWSEAAPYLLTLVLIAHHAVFGHIDLMVLGGYSLATWLTERLSNEVSSRTRLANRKISQRFEQLAHQQIDALCQWLDRQAPPTVQLDKLEEMNAELAEK